MNRKSLRFDASVRGTRRYDSCHGLFSVGNDPTIPSHHKVGYLLDTSGPMSSAIGSQARAWTDYFSYVNDAKGGIKGHKVEVVGRDTKYNIDSSVQVLPRFPEEEAHPR